MGIISVSQKEMTKEESIRVKFKAIEKTKVDGRVSHFARLTVGNKLERVVIYNKPQKDAKRLNLIPIHGIELEYLHEPIYVNDQWLEGCKVENCSECASRREAFNRVFVEVLSGKIKEVVGETIASVFPLYKQTNAMRMTPEVYSAVFNSIDEVRELGKDLISSLDSLESVQLFNCFQNFLEFTNELVLTSLEKLNKALEVMKREEKKKSLRKSTSSNVKKEAVEPTPKQEVVKEEPAEEKPVKKTRKRKKKVEEEA